MGAVTCKDLHNALSTHCDAIFRCYWEKTHTKRFARLTSFPPPPPPKYSELLGPFAWMRLPWWLWTSLLLLCIVATPRSIQVARDEAASPLDHHGPDVVAMVAASPHSPERYMEKGAPVHLALG